MVGTWHASAGGGNLTSTAINQSCQNINPETTVDALTATPDTVSRPYGQIGSISLLASNVALPSPAVGTGAEFQVVTCDTAASWPDFTTGSGAAVGDTGVQINVCFSPPTTEAIDGGAVGSVNIGTQAVTGRILHDGPYPASQGYRFCAWASIQAGGTANIQDSGQAWFDPIGQYTFIDQASLVNSSGQHTGSPAVFTTAGGKLAVDIWLPYTWTWTTTAPLVETLHETVLAGGETARAVSAQAQVSFSATLPSPVCPPVVGGGCIQGVGGLLATTDWLPGRETCTGPLMGCQMQSTVSGGVTYSNSYDIGLSPVGYPGSAIETAVNPVNPNTDVTPATDVTAGCGTDTTVNPPSEPWVYCSVYGRIQTGAIIGPIPAPVSTNASSYSATAQFLLNDLGFGA